MGRRLSSNLDILPPSTQRVENLRIEAKLTRSEMARRLGMTPSGFNLLFQRGSEISPVQARAISHEFGVSPQWILEGKGPQKISNEQELRQLKLRLCPDLSPEIMWDVFETYLQNSWMSVARLGRDESESELRSYTEKIEELSADLHWTEELFEKQQRFGELLVEVRELFLTLAKNIAFKTYEQQLLLEVLLDAKPVKEVDLKKNYLTLTFELGGDVDEFISQMKHFSELRIQMVDFFKPSMEIKKVYVRLVNQQMDEKEQESIKDRRQGQLLVNIDGWVRINEKGGVVEDTQRKEIFRQKIKIAAYEHSQLRKGKSENLITQRLVTLNEELESMIINWKEGGSDGTAN